MSIVLMNLLFRLDSSWRRGEGARAIESATTRWKSQCGWLCESVGSENGNGEKGRTRFRCSIRQVFTVRQRSRRDEKGFSQSAMHHVRIDSICSCSVSHQHPHHHLSFLFSDFQAFVHLPSPCRFNQSSRSSSSASESLSQSLHSASSSSHILGPIHWWTSLWSGSRQWVHS